MEGNSFWNNSFITPKMMAKSFILFIPAVFMGSWLRWAHGFSDTGVTCIVCGSSPLAAASSLS